MCDYKISEKNDCIRGDILMTPLKEKNVKI